MQYTRRHGFAEAAARLADHLGFRARRWHARRQDRRWGVETCTRVRPDDLDPVQDTGPAGLGNKGYEGVDARRFARMIAALRRHHGRDTRSLAFMDIGAGKGRAMMLATRWAWREIGGIELSQDLVDVAQANLVAFARHCPEAPALRLIQGDARQVALPAGPLVLFLYNPFDAAILGDFLEHARAQARGAPVWVLYCNPVHLEVMGRAPASGWLEMVERHPDWALLRSRPA